MSIADFVQEHVFPAENSQFVVRQDLLDAFTEWRQRPEMMPVMQMSDLEQATSDSRGVLPTEDFRTTLQVADSEGKKGTLSDCWVGWNMDWPNGNKTQPTPVVETSEPPVSEWGVDRHIHFCFHFNTADGYDRTQLQTYISKRVATTTPDDIQGLDQALEAAYNQLVASNREYPWRLKHVQHEGLVFTVFVAYRGNPGADMNISRHDCMDALGSMFDAAGSQGPTTAADDGYCDIC